MSNDTTTLNGALAELGETMAANITAKGVSASASDGLTTLAGKISQISQSGGGTPVVEFDNTNFGTHFAFTRPSGNYKDTFTIHVPSGTTHLVEYCFYYLKNLTGIDLPTGLTEIGQYAFYNCDSLTEVEIPNTVAAIGQYAFYYCTSLQSVNIPTSLSSIPSYCFRYSGLTSVTIPSNITSMSSYAFGNCSNLETIHFDSATPPTATSSTFQNLPTTCVIEVPCDSISAYTSASNYPSSSTYTYVPYGCNGLKFLQDSYTTNTGTCEVSLRLWDNNAPVSGGTITITGSDSSTYTCTTDSNGEATCTLTNISGTVTFTATYGNYSDTATVTAQSYLFKDECSSDNTSQYGSSVSLDGKVTTESLSFSTDHYVMSGSGAGFAGFVIPNVNQDNVKARIKFKLTQTSNAAYNQFGICVGQVGAVTTNNGLRVRNDKKFQQFNFTNGAESEGNVYTHTSNYSSNYFYVELIKQGTSLTIKLYDKDLNQLATNTRTITNYTNPQYIFYNLSVRGTSYATHIQEILVEPL